MKKPISARIAAGALVLGAPIIPAVGFETKEAITHIRASQDVAAAEEGLLGASSTAARIGIEIGDPACTAHVTAGYSPNMDAELRLEYYQILIGSGETHPCGQDDGLKTRALQYASSLDDIVTASDEYTAAAQRMPRSFSTDGLAENYLMSVGTILAFLGLRKLVAVARRSGRSRLGENKVSLDTFLDS